MLPQHDGYVSGDSLLPFLSMNVFTPAMTQQQQSHPYYLFLLDRLSYRFTVGYNTFGQFTSHHEMCDFEIVILLFAQYNRYRGVHTVKLVS